jgi:WD40 repeat protein
MARLVTFLKRHARPLLLAAFAVGMFGLWFGVWLRVLPLQPRVTIHVPDETELVGVSNDGRWIVTCVRPKLRPLQSPDGIQLLITRHSSTAGPVQVWDTNTESVVSQFLGPEDYCGDVQVSANGCFVAVADASRVRLFEALRGRELRMSPLPLSSSMGVASEHYGFSPDSRLFALLCRDDQGIPSVVVWDVEKEIKKQSFVGQASPFAFNSASSNLATASHADPSVVVVWDVQTGRELLRFQARMAIRELIFDLEGSRLAVLTPPLSCAPPNPAHVTLYDLDSRFECDRYEKVGLFMFMPNGAPLVRFAEEQDWFPFGETWKDVEGYSFPSPRGRYLVSQRWGSDEPVEWTERLASWLRGEPSPSSSYIRLHDLETGKVLWRLDGCSRFKLSSDENVAASRGPDDSLQLWDLPPRRPVFLLLALAAAPALLFTGVVWWRLVR